LVDSTAQRCCPVPSRAIEPQEQPLSWEDPPRGREARYGLPPGRIIPIGRGSARRVSTAPDEWLYCLHAPRRLPRAVRGGVPGKSATNSYLPTDEFADPCTGRDTERRKRRQWSPSDPLYAPVPGGECLSRGSPKANMR